VDTTIIQPTCFGNDGSIEINPIDGKEDLSISLDEETYQTELSFENLAVGNYTLYIERQSTCQKMQIPFVLEEMEQTTRMETARICENDEAYILPDGTYVTESGTYTSIITDNENCEVEIVTIL